MEPDMKKAMMIALVSGAAATSLAAPQESVTFTSVESRNHIGSATNVTRTASFTGAYTVQKLTIAGVLTDTPGTGTYSRESSILVTPPGGGAPFIIQPYGGDDTQLGQAVPAGSFAIPVTPVAATGNWSFQFFDYWDDTADDAPNATWSTVTITLDDAAPANPAPYNPAVNKVYSNVAVTPAIVTDTWNVTNTGSVDTVVVRGLGVATDANPSADINASPLYRVQVRVTAPGRAPVTISPFRNVAAGQVSVSSQTGEAFAAIPGGTLASAAGNWTVEIFDQLGTSASFLRNLSVSLGLSTPPSSTPFPALVGGSTVSATGSFSAAGQVRWYSIVVPAEVSAAANSALDLDMVGTTLAPQNDACFGLYSSTGALMGAAFNTGPGTLPLMSFGKGTRPGAGGDSLPYDGGNPNISPGGTVTANARPTLAAGTYYLAVLNGDDGAAFSPALYNVTNTTEANTGSFAVRARYLPTVTPVTPPSTDLGTIGGSLTRTATMDLDTYFEWYKITIPTNADDTSGKYLDIDTGNTPEPLNDTNIALYSSTGSLMSLNDDIAPGWTAANPTGGNSAMSFGMGSTPRDYSGVNANLPQGDGRDGPLAAGTYYLQVSPCCAGYGDNNFWVLNDYVTSPDLADITVHINTNYPPVGSACGAADVGGTGGVAGFDNHLDNNDFVVFIDFFFNHNPLADQGSTGGAPGADGVWDNNDFVVFIDNFFTAPASCR
jgi:hypothetical protein